MKKGKFKMLYNLMLCTALLCICTGCYAKKQKTQAPFSMYSPVDTLLRKELGDSVSSILLSPQTVYLQRLKIKNDSTDVIISKRLKSRDISIVTFLTACLDRFSKESFQYGKFSPNVRFVFGKKKASVIYEIDFGSRLIMIKDQKGNLLKLSPIKDNKLLQFCLTKFTDDEFLSYMIKH